MHARELFGQWVKRQRKALLLTQETLAQQVGCATSTIFLLEQNRRRPSKALARRLADVLKIPPEERTRFAEAARSLPGTEPAVGTLAAPPEPPQAMSLTPDVTMLVPATPLFGRRQDATVLCELLLKPPPRLVTITGAPGIGKTRLALDVARILTPRYHHGSEVVSLAHVRHATDVLDGIARGLGVMVRSQQQLVPTLMQLLQEQHLLLVLDNFEQVLEAAPLLGQLLDQCPQLVMLVTSRIALGLAMEHTYQLAPLALPAHDEEHDLVVLAANPAVACFVDRSQAVNGAFALTQANASAVAAICRQLDGIPLALELAATRTLLLSPQALLTHLRQRRAFLTWGPRDLPARQQTLQAAIAWSYELLSSAEQRLFAWLAVFAGGWTLKAVQDLWHKGHSDGEQDQLLRGLRALVDHNLVRQHVGPDGTLRFDMLEMICECALVQLTRTGEEERLRRLHAEVYLDIVIGMRDDLFGPSQRTVIDVLEGEHANIRAALEWALAKPATELALTFCVVLWDFWRRRGYHTQARPWIEQTLMLSQPATTVERVQLLYGAAWVAQDQHDLVRAGELFQQSLTLALALGDRRLIAEALHGKGEVLMLQGQYQEASAALLQSLDLLREVDDQSEVAWTLGHLARIALLQDAYDQASGLLREAETLFLNAVNKQGHAWSLHHLGLVALCQARSATAQELLEEAALRFREAGDNQGLARALQKLASAMISLQDYPRALTVLVDALGLFRQLASETGMVCCMIGIVQLLVAAEAYAEAVLVCSAIAPRMAFAEMDRVDSEAYQLALSVARGGLDQAAFDASWRKGQTLSLAEVRELVRTSFPELFRRRGLSP